MRRPPSRSELTPVVSLPSLYNPRDLALIRRTVATDTTDDEFALFIHWARSLRSIRCAGRRDARTPRTDRRPRRAHHRLARRRAPRRGAPRPAR